MDFLVVHRWRSLLLKDVQGDALEIGVGTGLNFPFYPPREQAQIVAVDIAEEMLKRARENKGRLGVDADLRLADAHHLPFEGNRFDTVFTAFVFCSVADPVQGLREVFRVLRPGGQLRLLEHQRPPQPILANLFDGLNPLAVRLTGVNINRTTDKNVTAAGFTQVSSKQLERSGIFRLITARKPHEPKET
jgi:phosphatidylethanolamine/phosphatidyl-N-methylethanolamine N-methyltransferase